jgi:hypothetical protein
VKYLLLAQSFENNTKSQSIKVLVKLYLDDTQEEEEEEKIIFSNYIECGELKPFGLLFMASLAWSSV